MNVFKPLQASLLYKTFEWDGKHRLAVSVLFGFTFNNEEPLLEQEVWALLPSEIGPNGVLDLCMPKPNGEALVYGSYYSPDGKPVTAGTVQLKVGTIDKKLMIFGDRYWRAVVGPSEPEPFRVMPLDYAHAFGGAGFARNPVGKGMVDVDVYGEMRRPLPNIESPKSIMTSSGQQPDPAGFAPLDVAWEFRSTKLGTYDEDWIRERAPEYAKDLDWNHFNAAPSDQWVETFFTGTEEFELSNMHPEKRSIKGRLPGFRARCFVEKTKSSNEQQIDEVPLHAETVWFLPHLETGVILYRGVTEITTDDAKDISHLLVAYENIKDTPRSKTHYENALRNRIDPEKSHLYMMDTTDIIPEGATCGYVAASGLDPAYEEAIRKQEEEEEKIAKQEAESALEKEKNRLTELFTSVGIDASPFITKINNIEKTAGLLSGFHNPEEKMHSELNKITAKLDLNSIDLAKVEELVDRAEDMSPERESVAKGMLKTLSQHLTPLAEGEKIKERITQAITKLEELPTYPRPPESEIGSRYTVAEQGTEHLSDEHLNNAKSDDSSNLTESENNGFILTLTEAGQETRNSYRVQAHLLEKCVPPHNIPLETVRDYLIERIRKKQPVAGGDYSGVDLSNADLSGVDFSGCYLESVNFSSANLQGANLESAILVFANLSRCNLTGSNLKQANLGSSNLSEAVFNQSDMTEVQLGRSNLKAAKFQGCDLTDADFTEAKCIDTDFSHAKLPNASFIQLVMSRSRFSNAFLIGSEFTNCQLEASVFSEATLDEASWIESNLDGANFTEAKMTNTRFPGGTSLRGAKFVRAMLDTANLRGTQLEGADFTEASLNMSDFGDAKAEKAIFTRSVAKSAQFIGTDLAGADMSEMDLMEASLMKARLTSAKLIKSNCYGVEFMNAIVGETKFTGANLTQTKLEKWSPGR